MSNDNPIVGFRTYGHDNAIVKIDFKKKDIFAIATERITRIKHDEASILPLFEKELPETILDSFTDDFLKRSERSFNFFVLYHELYKTLKIKYIRDRKRLFKN